MNVFELRKRLVEDYRAYVKSFIAIADPRIREHVDRELDDNELLRPQARIGLNPAFAEGAWIDDLVAAGTLHPDCSRIFRLKTHGEGPGPPAQAASPPGRGRPSGAGRAQLRPDHWHGFGEEPGLYHSDRRPRAPW